MIARGVAYRASRDPALPSMAHAATDTAVSCGQAWFVRQALSFLRVPPGSLQSGVRTLTDETPGGTAIYKYKGG